ncbi:glycosyltransferase family 2 protein [Aequorivita sinensis]|uniref:glycosyltransferase family 2 protein n=1 Tax=Aequorivita sinensis TaxID=1382458 RepID=UPI0023005734|nr:glycosyltransferase family 2 protein [Aequorivita sinensis]
MSLENSGKNTYVVIVTYNAMSYIQKCLDSCVKQPIVIVDNNSSDDTVTFIKKHYPNVYLLPQKVNLGFGQANNLGIRFALEKGAEYVFLLNQDAYLKEGTLEKLIQVNQTFSEFGILSPIHLNGNGDRLDQNFSNYVSYRNNQNFYSDFIINKPLKAVYEVPFVNAAGWLLSKDVLDTVGGFDPIFFHYGEDDNYCQRAAYHGFKIGVVPTAFLLHDRENRTSKELEYGTKQYFERKSRSLKLKFADINLNNSKELAELILKRKKSRIKEYIKLDFKRVSYLNKEIEMLERIANEVRLSKEQNKIVGRNYLNNY